MFSNSIKIMRIFKCLLFLLNAVLQISVSQTITILCSLIRIAKYWLCLALSKNKMFSKSCWIHTSGTQMKLRWWFQELLRTLMESIIILALKMDFWFNYWLLIFQLSKYFKELQKFLTFRYAPTIWPLLLNKDSLLFTTKT